VEVGGKTSSSVRCLGFAAYRLITTAKTPGTTKMTMPAINESIDSLKVDFQESPVLVETGLAHRDAAAPLRSSDVRH